MLLVATERSFTTFASGLLSLTTVSELQGMGIQNHSDRSLIKKKVKMIKNRIERERKMLEKESRTRVIAQGMHIQM